MSPWLRKSRDDMASTGTADAVTDRGCARLPTTTICSWKRTDSAASSVTVAPALISTTSRIVAKPGRVNVTSYAPG